MNEWRTISGKSMVMARSATVRLWHGDSGERTVTARSLHGPGAVTVIVRSRQGLLGSVRARFGDSPGAVPPRSLSGPCLGVVRFWCVHRDGPVTTRSLYGRCTVHAWCNTSTLRYCGLHSNALRAQLLLAIAPGCCMHRKEQHAAKINE